MMSLDGATWGHGCLADLPDALRMYREILPFVRLTHLASVTVDTV